MVKSVISLVSSVLCGMWLVSVVRSGVLIVMFSVYRLMSRLVDGRLMLRLVLIVGISLMIMNLVVLMVKVLMVSVSNVSGMMGFGF